MKRFLISTALKNTWKFEEPVLFLGSWCMQYKNKDIWSSMDYDLVPYHWDDIGKLKRDEAYCFEVYEKLLLDICKELNFHHKVQWSVRSWKILIGPWLRRYVTILFDRWTCIKLAVENFEIDSVACTSYEPGSLIAKNHGEFTSLYHRDDWNYKLFSRIICETTSLKVTEIPIISDNIKTHNLIEKTPFHLNRFINKIPKQIYLSNFVQFILRKLARHNKFYLYKTFIPKFADVLKLQYKLGDFPYAKLFEPSIPDAEVDLELRKNFKPEGGKSKFESYLRKLLPDIIPTIYLEGFENLISKLNNGDFPEKPRVIFTGTGIYQDELFQAWTAKKINKGAILAIVQHGGHYGNFEVSSEAMPHELSVADYYYSWGWTLKSENIIPMPAIKAIGKSSDWSESGYITIMTRPLYRYCYALSTGSLPGKAFYEYPQRLIQIINSMPESEKNNYYVRLFPGEGSQPERGEPVGPQLNDKVQNAKIMLSNKPLDECLLESKLVVFTYDGTPFLESIAVNRPCIVISYPEREPLNIYSKPYYQAIKKVGIYHESVESAVKHIRKVSNRISEWWWDESTEKAKALFCDNFARRSDSALDDFSKELLKLVQPDNIKNNLTSKNNRINNSI
jgi:putative transferase (TIGR04331 family)